ncbi:MAG TPA: hypothetical protein VEL76_10540 [Gemmataceae bacterium]|nr:hypothetical protein [Gemmataceae bacterium]
MKIGYLTIDEVNQRLAVELAGACGAVLEIVWPRDEPPDGRFDAVLYDLDCRPPSEREQLLGVLLAGPVTCPVALHSYNLEEHQIETLQANGIAVHRTLASEAFQSLALAVAPATPPSELQETSAAQQRLAAQLS